MNVHKDIATRPQARPDTQDFRLLSQADFERLSVEQKVAYLKAALEVRHAIDAQLDAWRFNGASGRTFKHY